MVGPQFLLLARYSATFLHHQPLVGLADGDGSVVGGVVGGVVGVTTGVAGSLTVGEGSGAGAGNPSISFHPRVGSLVDAPGGHSRVTTEAGMSTLYRPGSGEFPPTSIHTSVKLKHFQYAGDPIHTSPVAMLVGFG